MFLAINNLSIYLLYLFQHITRTEGEVQLEGSNASAEETDEGVDSNSVSGIDLILNHRLVETGQNIDLFRIGREDDILINHSV